MGLHMPILMISFLDQGVERNMLQSSVISLLLSHILCRLYSVVLIIKLYTSEASVPKLCEPKLEAILKIGGLASLYLGFPFSNHDTKNEFTSHRDVERHSD